MVKEQIRRLMAKRFRVQGIEEGSYQTEGCLENKLLQN